jgi:predicted aspartyl protease
VICPHCKSENSGTSNICVNCGSHLRATVRPRYKNTTQLWMLGSAIILIVGLFLVYKFILSGKETSTQIETVAIESPAYELTPKAQKSLRHAIGKVIVKTSMGIDLNHIETAIVNRSWIALPVCACLSGNNWMFHSAELRGMNRAQIVNGIWEPENPVGLWKLEKGIDLDSLELVPWNRGNPLEWHSLNMDRSVGQIPVISPIQAGYFTSITIQNDVDEPGVFIQSDRIVGWTFGEWIETGILWDPPQGFQLEQAVSLDVTEFVNAVSSSWQETYFSKGLAVKAETAPIERLELLAEGFLVYPQFSAEFKPLSLRSGSITTQIHSLTARLLKDGFSRDVMDILSDDLILEAKNLELLKDATQARVKTYDHWKAVQYLERMKRSLLSGGEPHPSDLDVFHAQLYKDWIKQSIDEETFHSGRIGFEAGRSLFPNDVELHLLGVDLAIAENDWERAEELIKMRTYPQEFQERVGSLESIIERKIEEEVAVVIRFNPGSKRIPVKAHLNRQVWQNFIIDTGATISLIPSGAATALGLRVTRNTPVRGVTGVAGVTLAYEVVLKSIELKGFEVRNIPVLVVDMPGASDVGLLGNDFLKNFDIEIDNQNGILKLRPRNKY